MAFEQMNQGMFEQISTDEMASIQGGIVGGTNCTCVSSTTTGTACHSDGCTDCGDIDSSASLSGS
ncbi:MAG: bacteriocin [Chitinophagaceae bacterium]|nr:bacteriocin [Chitinophagaceae bacterium]